MAKEKLPPVSQTPPIQKTPAYIPIPPIKPGELPPTRPAQEAQPETPTPALPPTILNLSEVDLATTLALLLKLQAASNAAWLEAQDHAMTARQAAAVTLAAGMIAARVALPRLYEAHPAERGFQQAAADLRQRAYTLADALLIEPEKG